MRLLKVFLGAVLCVCMATGLWGETAMTVNAQNATWADAVTSRPETGYDQDEDGNVAITTKEGLAWLISLVNGSNGQSVNNFENKTVTLMADIDLSDYLWAAIGSFSRQFNGVFDGNHHTISGLRLICNSNDQGFIGFLNSNGTIKDLTIIGTLAGGSSCGGVCGCNFGKIINCSFSGSVTNSIANYGDNFGGIAGDSYGDIFNCVNYGAISGTYNTGGIVGRIQENGIVANCFNVGSVASEYNNPGGVVGDTLNGGYARESYWLDTSAVSGIGNVDSNNESVGIVKFTSDNGGTFISPITVGSTTDILSLVNALNAGRRSNEMLPWAKINDDSYPDHYCTVNYALTDVTSNGNTLASYNVSYTAALTTATGYNLPTRITVMVGDTALANTEYVYQDGTLTIPADKVTGNIAITAAGSLKTYTVTFYADGETVAARTAEHGYGVTDIPDIPAKTGYDQTAPVWNVTDFTNITADMTVNAVYTLNVYAVTLPASSVGYEIINQGDRTVNHGGSFHFGITIASGYNGNNIVVKANGTVLEPVDGVYTVSGIAGNQTITVEGINAIPDTGDASNMLLWISLMILSVCAISALGMKSKKEQLNSNSHQ